MNNDDINNLLMLDIIKINTHITEMEEVEEDLNKKAGNKRIWFSNGYKTGKWNMQVLGVHFKNKLKKTKYLLQIFSE